MIKCFNCPNTPTHYVNVIIAPKGEDTTYADDYACQEDVALFIARHADRYSGNELLEAEVKHLSL